MGAFLYALDGQYCERIVVRCADDSGYRSAGHTLDFKA
jgi:hypothetical protein